MEITGKVVAECENRLSAVRLRSPTQLHQGKTDLVNQSVSGVWMCGGSESHALENRLGVPRQGPRLCLQIQQCAHTVSAHISKSEIQSELKKCSPTLLPDIHLPAGFIPTQYRMHLSYLIESFLRQ